MQIKRGGAFEIKEVSDAGAIIGYGSVFGNVDQGNDIVEKGAFTKSLETRGMPKMLWSHDMWEPPIGKWNKAEEDDHGLLLEGSLNMKMQRGSEVHAALKMETLEGLSIGYMEKVAESGKDGVRHLKELDLFEVSVVTFPMNELARVDSVKDRIMNADNPRRALAKILRDAGFSRTQAEALVARGFDAWEQSDSVDDGAIDPIEAEPLIIPIFK